MEPMHLFSKLSLDLQVPLLVIKVLKSAHCVIFAHDNSRTSRHITVEVS